MNSLFSSTGPGAVKRYRRGVKAPRFVIDPSIPDWWRAGWDDIFNATEFSLEEEVLVGTTTEVFDGNPAGCVLILAQSGDFVLVNPLKITGALCLRSR